MSDTKVHMPEIVRLVRHRSAHFPQYSIPVPTVGYDRYHDTPFQYRASHSARRPTAQSSGNHRDEEDDRARAREKVVRFKAAAVRPHIRGRPATPPNVTFLCRRALCGVSTFDAISSFGPAQKAPRRTQPFFSQPTKPAQPPHRVSAGLRNASAKPAQSPRKAQCAGRARSQPRLSDRLQKGLGGSRATHSMTTTHSLSDVRWHSASTAPPYLKAIGPVLVAPSTTSVPEMA